MNTRILELKKDVTDIWRPFLWEILDPPRNMDIKRRKKDKLFVHSFNKRHLDITASLLKVQKQNDSIMISNCDIKH